MSKKIKIIILAAFALSLLFSLPLPTLAASWLDGIVPGGSLVPESCVKFKAGDDINSQCGLTQVFQMIISFSKIILALSGSAALLMFIYGGVLWIISTGSQEQIQKGKAAMAAATIGLIIILSSWLIINFAILALTGGEVGGEATIFGGQPWSQAPSGGSGTK